jgi:nucleotidyltransferase/DNA polymerase involved in DNA repair
VVTSRERKSISKEQTFARDVRDAARLRQTIRDQAAAVAATLQRKQVRGTTVKLKLRWADFTTLTRQATLPRATNQETPIVTAALRLLDQAWDGRRAVRLYGFTRDELRCILDPADVYGPDFPGETFRVLKEKGTRQYGEYRTRRLVLAAFDNEK